MESEPLSVRVNNLFFCTFLGWRKVQSCLVRTFFAIVDLNREDEASIEFFRNQYVSCGMGKGSVWSLSS